MRDKDKRVISDTYTIEGNDSEGLTLEALGRKGSSQKNASMPRNPPDKSSDIFLCLDVKLFTAQVNVTVYQ